MEIGNISLLEISEEQGCLHINPYDFEEKCFYDEPFSYGWEPIGVLPNKLINSFEEFCELAAFGKIKNKGRIRELDKETLRNYYTAFTFSFKNKLDIEMVKAFEIFVIKIKPIL